MKTKNAFTLVEILIVLAILGVLVALTFPVTARVREKGRQATCQQNMRQIHAAMQMYVQDHDSRFPSFVTWESDLASYTKSTAVFLCPSQTHPHGQDPGPIHYGREDYGLNLAQLNDITTPAKDASGTEAFKFGGTHEAKFEQADQIIMFWEVGHDGMDQQMPLPASCGKVTMADGRPDTMWSEATVHSGGGNKLFLDGHVKWFSPDAAAEAWCTSINSGPVDPIFRKPK